MTYTERQEFSSLRRWQVMHRHVFALLCSLTCRLATAVGDPSFGFVEIREGSLYLHTPTRRSDIDVVWVQTSGNGPRCCVRIEKRSVLEGPPQPSVDSGNVSGDEPVFMYLLFPPADIRLDQFFVGMALINIRPPISATKDSMQGRTANGQRYKIRKCVASEGINLTGPRAAGPAPTLYYGLGYEIDQTQLSRETSCQGPRK